MLIFAPVLVRLHPCCAPTSTRSPLRMFQLFFLALHTSLAFLFNTSARITSVAKLRIAYFHVNNSLFPAVDLTLCFSVRNLGLVLLLQYCAVSAAVSYHSHLVGSTNMSPGSAHPGCKLDAGGDLITCEVDVTMVEIELGPVGVHGQRGVTMLPSSLACTSGLAWRGRMVGFWVCSSSGRCSCSNPCLQGEGHIDVSLTLESLMVSGDLDFVVALVPVATGLLYFSAHWCSPCRKFLPKLIEEYIKMREETSSDDEVVFVSNTDGQEKRNCHLLSVEAWVIVARVSSNIVNVVSCSSSAIVSSSSISISIFVSSSSSSRVVLFLLLIIIFCNHKLALILDRKQ
uniref:protein-disulfide reductase n=1 Tax=Oryza meridionalis TaxID=40149 RepID=A0A0E0F3T7_9ORYZ